uniref:(northern house mosquito) hypothetical protein n=2 Tax=Culex pipiens TaxID=7175 RepID=A0A8D8JU92_CULPI
MGKRIKKTIATGKVPSKFIIFAVSMGATLGIEKQKFAVGKSNPFPLYQFYFYCFFLSTCFASIFPSTLLFLTYCSHSSFSSLFLCFFLLQARQSSIFTFLSLLNCLLMFYACLLRTQIPVCWLPGFLIASHFAEKKKIPNC